ncbi:MAG: tetratricopeptide repeat protein, partial [Nannocystaceae bacterium]
IAGVVLAVPGIAAGVAYGGTPDPCPRPSVRSLGWDDAARTTVLAAYEASGLADAETARDTVIARMDGAMTELADARVSACEATHVQHAQSEAMLDLRMLCLQRTSDRVSGLVRAIEAADADGLDRLVDAVEGLPSPSVCGPEQLVGAATMPATAELAAEVTEARAAIADARASHELGDDRRAKQQLDALEPRVLALQHPPLLAELRLTQGIVAKYFGEPTDAAALLLEAAELAEGSRSDLLAAEIWDGLTFLAHEELSVAEVDAWLPRARAAVTRLGSPPYMRTSIELHEAKLAMRNDDLGRAQTLLEEVVRQRDEQGLPLERAKALEALVHLHRLRDEPQRALERLEQIEGIQRQQLGPRHVKVGDTAYNRGTILVTLGRWNEARSSLETAMEIWTERYGPQYLDLALIHIAMQPIELNAGTVDAALRHAEDALRIRRAHLPEGHPEVANAHMAVGIAHMFRGEPGAALRAYTTAEQGLRAASGDDDVMVALAQANLAEAELATGRVAEAREHVDSATEVLQRFIPSHPSTALPLKIRGKLALLEGDATAAVGHLQQALARLESADTVDPLEHGDVLLTLGAALDAAGRHAQAQQQFAAAERIYEAGSGDVCERGLARARKLRTEPPLSRKERR